MYFKLCHSLKCIKYPDFIDSETLYSKSIQKLCDRWDKEYTFDVKVKAMGRTQRESATVIINELNLPITIEEYIKETMANQRELFPSCQLLPGMKTSL